MISITSKSSCTFSICFVCEGSQIHEEYSSFGLTRALYAWSLIFCEFTFSKVFGQKVEITDVSHVTSVLVKDCHFWRFTFGSGDLKMEKTVMAMEKLSKLFPD